MLYLESPSFVVPAGPTPLRVAFDHWVATEADWDGGNLKVSVNGGPWTLVPASAYTFNAYNLALTPVNLENTNPMAGEAAFSGTDGGSNSGSWGQSQIDLTGIVAVGDTVQFRFEQGQDQCAGSIGWYVDDVRVYYCFMPGTPATVTVTANPTSMVADGISTSTLTALVKDVNGNPAPGQSVAFVTTRGAVTSPAVTNASGVATAILTSPTTAGTASVTATAASASSNTQVTFTAGAPATVVVTANPTGVVADGVSTSTLTALVKDVNGNPAPGQPVVFATILGAVTSPAVTNASGVATAILTSPTTAGTASVTATAASASGNTQVTFTASAPATVMVTANPTSVVADGISTSTLTALVKDVNGNPAPGQSVAFVTTRGAVTSPAVTNASGVATAILTSPTTAGTASVTATADSAGGNTQVTFTAGAPATVTVTANPTSMVADGISTSTLTALVKDVNGNPAPGQSVVFATILGAVTSPAVTNASGVATAILTSATTAGTASVTATAGVVFGAGQVLIVAGPPTTITLSANPPVLEILDGDSVFTVAHSNGITTTITALVSDAHENPVTGQVVSFTTTIGQISPSATTDGAGRALAIMTPGPIAGAAGVTAKAGAVQNSFEVVINDLRSRKLFLPLVTQ